MSALLRMPFTYCVVGIACAFFESVRADWTGLVVLGALIALYAFLAKGDKDEGRFRTGDNAYFLGFVYTLSVITLSLILDADTLLGGAGEGVSPLLKTIGIALGTSVIGMLCRFLLTHDIPVAEDVFDVAVREAAVAAASLKGVVDSATKSAAPLSDAVREAAEAAAPLGKVVSGLRQTVNDASRALEAQIRVNGTSLNGLVGEFRGAVKEFSTEAAASLNAMTKDATDETKRAVRAEAERAAAQNADTVRGLGQSVNAHAEAVRASLEGITSSLGGYTEAIHVSAHRFGETLDKATSQAVGQVAEGVVESLQENTFADARRGLEDAVRTYQEGVSAVNQTLASALDGLTGATKAAVVEAGEASSALAGIDSAAVRRDLEGLTEAIGRLRDTVNALNERLPQLADREFAPPRQAPAPPAPHPRGNIDPRGPATADGPSSGFDSPPLVSAPAKTGDGRGFSRWVPWPRR